MSDQDTAVDLNNISDDDEEYEWKNKTKASTTLQKNPENEYNKNKNVKKLTKDEIWGEVELSDDESENENEETTKKTLSRKSNEFPSGLTENDVNGDFPKFKSKSDDESDSDEDEIQVKKEKPNPYLAHLNSNTAKYSKKLRELHLKRNEARKLNHQEVAAEDQRKKLPANYEARRKRAEWELEDQKARKVADEAGEDYERVKMLEETAEEVETFENRKRKKKNLDPGFSDYAAAQLRQYERLTKQMKPDIVAYKEGKEKLGESAFPSAHNLMYGGNGECSETAIDRMVGDLEKQIEKRGKFHRRRQHFDESDIDYINEKNRKFNQKADRFYGNYTKEIRENLERGTAI